MIRYVLALIVAASVFIQVQNAFSQMAEEFKAMKDEVKVLKEGQGEIKKDTQDIKAQIKANPASAAFTETVVNVDGDPFKGRNDAKVALVEFSNYRWPLCSKHVRETVPQIEKEYVDTGKIRYILLDLPFGSNNPAFKAAEAAACAGEQGKFWEMRDTLFENQKDLTHESLVKYAEKISVDMPKFKECLDSGKYAYKIKQDRAEGKKAGIKSTPSSLLGWIQSDGKSVKAVKKISGAKPYSVIKEALDNLLNTKVE